MAESKANRSKELRQHPRFSTKPLHSLSLQTVDGKTITIANISLGGVGLITDENVKKLAGDFEAMLSVGPGKFKIQLAKVYQGEKITGCSFRGPEAELQKGIDNYFQTEILALKVDRVETMPDRNNKQDKILFYHGQNNCELLINERNSQICYFSVVVLGNSVEVEPKKSIQVGERVDDKKVPVKNGVFLFKPQRASKHIIDNAIRFIDNIEHLSLEYRQNLIHLLNETPMHPTGEKTKSSRR